MEILREELTEKNRQISKAAPAISPDRLKRSPRPPMVAILVLATRSRMATTTDAIQT